MSKTSTDLSTFLTTIDTITDRLKPPRRSQDTKVPDCTVREMSALEAISKHGSLYMSDLATIIAVPVSTSTRIVDQLVSKKMLTRKPSEEDARKIEVTFAPLGSEINTYIEQTRQASASSMLSVLSDTERATLLNQLSRLLAPPPK